jgi:hypothetical protein
MDPERRERWTIMFERTRRRVERSAAVSDSAYGLLRAVERRAAGPGLRSDGEGLWRFGLQARAGAGAASWPRRRRSPTRSASVRPRDSGPGAMPGPLCYATPVSTDDLAAYTASLRARVEAGEPQGDVRGRADLLLNGVNSFRHTAETRRMPEPWDPLRRRPAG